MAPFVCAFLVNSETRSGVFALLPMGQAISQLPPTGWIHLLSGWLVYSCFGLRRWFLVPRAWLLSRHVFFNPEPANFAQTSGCGLIRQMRRVQAKLNIQTVKNDVDCVAKSSRDRRKGSHAAIRGRRVMAFFVLKRFIKCNSAHRLESRWRDRFRADGRPGRQRTSRAGPVGPGRWQTRDPSLRSRGMRIRWTCRAGAGGEQQMDTQPGCHQHSRHMPKTFE